MKIHTAIRALVLGIIIWQPGFVMASPDIVETSVEEDFVDVIIDIENAIANRGYVVDYKANIGEMLSRTAADVGSTKTVYLNAHTWQFCSSLLSREMMEENASNIAYCPYVIFAYETVDAAGTVVVGFLRKGGSQPDNASAQAASKVDDILQGIVSESTE